MRSIRAIAMPNILHQYDGHCGFYNRVKCNIKIIIVHVKNKNKRAIANGALLKRRLHLRARHCSKRNQTAKNANPNKIENRSQGSSVEKEKVRMAIMGWNPYQPSKSTLTGWPPNELKTSMTLIGTKIKAETKDKSKCLS